MSTSTRALALAGALLTALVAGALILTAGGGSKPVPTLTPPATPGPQALVPNVPLAAGTYTRQVQAGRLTFTLPAGWSNTDGGELNFALHLDAGPADDTVAVFFDMRRPAKDAGCTEAPDLSVLPTVDALISDLSVDPNLQVENAGTVHANGARGLALDIALASTANRTCPWSNGRLSVPLVVDSVAGEGPFWGIGPNERERLVAIDAVRGHNIVVVIDSAAETSFDQLAAATMPIIESFSFEPAATNAPLFTPAPCEDNLAGCTGELTASPHRSNAFQPTVTFTTPSGWTNVVDTPTIYKLDPQAGSGSYLIAWSKVALPNGCDAVPKPGTTNKISDFVDFLTNHPGIEILPRSLGSRPLGQWPARILDLRVKDGYTDGCPGVPGNTVPFILDTDPVAGTQVYGVSSGSRMHLLIADVNGRTVIIQASTPDSDAGFSAAIAQIEPVLDSFQMGPTN